MAETKKVLITGGSGFLGSHVADALSEAGYGVRIFDSEPSPYLRADQEMVLGDILDGDALADAAKGCSVITHFAGFADIGESSNEPVKTAELNVMGTINALEAARQNGAERIVLASTVYVFSESGSFYRASKQSAERFVETYHDRYGLNYTIVRYGSLYGRRAGASNMIHHMVRDALNKNKIFYPGDGAATREYIHVADAANLSVEILKPEHANRHLVLTGIERMKVSDVMNMIAEIAPGNIKLEIAADPGQMHGSHYVITPYDFKPRIGHKLVATDFVDLGQGLLDCFNEAQEESGNSSMLENEIALNSSRSSD